MTDVGDMGEDFFSGLCTHGGLTSNKVQRDKKGWDNYVQFPKEKINSQFPFHSKSPIHCLVQVKSSNNQQNSWSVKVSSLDYLVWTQQPVFYCFIEFDGGVTPTRIYLVHVGKNIIENTLKKVWELKNKGEDHQLHKHCMSIQYGENELLEEITGKCLKKTIEKYISDGIEKYLNYKNRLLKTLGFEKGSEKLHFNIPSKNPIEDLVDFQLGLRKELPIENIKGHHFRFGQESIKPFLNQKKGSFVQQNLKPQGEVTLFFRKHKNSRSIIIKGNVYYPQIICPIPNELLKRRIQCDFLDITFEPSQYLFKFLMDIKYNQITNLKNLKNILSIEEISTKSSDEIFLEIVENSKVVLSDTLHLHSKEGFTNFPELLKIVKMCSQICNRFQISENDVSVCLNDLLRYKNLIEEFYTIICNYKNETMKTVFSRKDIDVSVFNSEVGTGCIYPLITLIGDHKLCCVVGCIGSLHKNEDNKYVFISQEIRLGGKLISNINENFDKKITIQEYDKLEKELTGEGIDVIKFDPLDINFPILPENLD